MQQFSPYLKCNVSFIRQPVGTSFDFKILSKKTLQTLLALTAIVSDSVKQWGNMFISPLYNLKRFHLEGVLSRCYCFVL